MLRESFLAVITSGQSSTIFQYFLNCLRSLFGRVKPVADAPQELIITDPTPIRVVERRHMQTPNGSTVPKYSGPMEYLLVSTNCLELSQITNEQLAWFAETEGATPLQFSRLLALWTGGQDVSPELQTLVGEISWPKEKERLLKVLGSVPSPELERLAWR